MSATGLTGKGSWPAKKILLSYTILYISVKLSNLYFALDSDSSSDIIKAVLNIYNPPPGPGFLGRIPNCSTGAFLWRVSILIGSEQRQEIENILTRCSVYWLNQ